MKETIEGRFVRVGDVMESKLIDGVMRHWWAGEEITEVVHEVLDPANPPIVWVWFGPFRRLLNVDDLVTVVRENDTEPEPEKASP